MASPDAADYPTSAGVPWCAQTDCSGLFPVVRMGTSPEHAREAGGVQRMGACCGTNAPRLRRKTLGRHEMKHALVSLAIAASLLGARPVARSCAPPPPIENEFALSAAVFVGRVTATEVVVGTKPFSTQTVATFSVERAWKGITEPTVRVATCGGGDVVCTVGVVFRVGERYVVFAAGKPLATSTCSRTGTAADSQWQTTWEWLRRLPSQPAGFQETVRSRGSF
jgi:hypothetical protein